MDLNTAHRILGVNLHTSKDQVKNSYKKLVKKWHPDRHIDDKIKYSYAEENIKKIIEAYKYILNHNSWNFRTDLKDFKKKQENYQKSQFQFKFIFLKIINFIKICFQYCLILIGLPFIIFWYHPLHSEIFPYLHSSPNKYKNKIDKENIMFVFNNTHSISQFDVIEESQKISLNFFLDSLANNNKNGKINFIDLDQDGIDEIVISISSTISNQYHHSMILFSYKNKNNYQFVKNFNNGTILDYSNRVFVQPLFNFDSFYFCDSCYFSSEIINNKSLKYISPKVKYVFFENKLYYQKSNKKLNEKIVSNLRLLNDYSLDIKKNEFDNGLRRLYAENMLSHYYNNFDLNQARDLFYKFYNLNDKHIIWKGIVVELIKEYSVLDRKDENI